MRTTRHKEAPTVHVFKTNIHADEEHALISDLLNSHQAILNWSIDRADKDRVLRVEATDKDPQLIIALIEQNGFSCAELTD